MVRVVTTIKPTIGPMYGIRFKSEHRKAITIASSTPRIKRIIV